MGPAKAGPTPTTPPPPTTEQTPPPTTPPSSATDFNLREFDPRTPPPQTIPSRPEITFPVTPPGKRPVHLFELPPLIGLSEEYTDNFNLTPSNHKSNFRSMLSFERGYAEPFTSGQNQGVVLTTGGSASVVSPLPFTPWLSGRASIAYHQNDFT
jgi:hypothetical protein